MTHSVTIKSVDTRTINEFQNVVCRIHYTLTWTNSDSSTVSEDFALLLIDPDDAANYPDTSGFTAYDSVTEGQMVGWIEGSPIFNKLTASLSQRKTVDTPSTHSPALPWN